MTDGRYHQFVPRPEQVVLGPQPPWSEHLSTAVSVPIAALRQCFPRFDPESWPVKGVLSSVLVPVLDVAGEATLVLTRRSALLERDPGNVSFPGGRLEQGEHPLAGAFREAEEEIGLSPSRVEVIGCLSPVGRRRDGEVVTPYVGLVSGKAEFTPNRDEVETMLAVPIGSLYETGAAWEERWGRAPEDRPIRFFAHAERLGMDLIWGLTARMVWDLLERLSVVLVDAPRSP